MSELGEAGLLRLLRRRLGAASPHVELGIGDDAAVLRGAGRQVLTHDVLVEDVDFRRRWASWRDVGHKAASVNLSDVAAMGAVPRALLVGLCAAGEERAADMLALLAACHAQGRRSDAPVVGGDLSRTAGPVVVAVTAIGALHGPPWRRGRGRAGDIVAVTGALGAAAAGLQLLEDATLCRTMGLRARGALERAQLRPGHRAALVAPLRAAGGVRSCADVSDGLGKDAMHLPGPGLGVELDAAAIPVAPGVAAVAQALGLHPLALALWGGEDFELALAVAPRAFAGLRAAAAAAGVPLTAVGRVGGSRGLHGLPDAAQPGAGRAGFEHFVA